jgi:hypothetical protein
MTPTQNNPAVTPLLNGPSTKRMRTRSLIVPLMGVLILCQFIALWLSFSGSTSESSVPVVAESDSRFAPAVEMLAPVQKDAGVSNQEEASVGIIFTEDPVIEPVRIKLKVNDYQFYRPDDRYRVVRPAPKKLQRFKVQKFGRFGFGLILEGENTGKELLNEPILSGHFIFHTKQGPLDCPLEPISNHLSLDTSHSRYLWVDESSDDAERVWRPGEIIRWVVYKECFETFAFEKSIEKVSLHVMVEMKVGPLDGKTVTSSPIEINLPGGVLTAQPIRRDDGVMAFLSGQNLIELRGQDFLKTTLFKAQKMVTDFSFKPLLKTTLPLRINIAEGFDVDVDVTRILSWQEHARARKGMRVVEMKAKLQLNTDVASQKAEQEIGIAEGETKRIYEEMSAAETQYRILKGQAANDRMLWGDVNDAKRSWYQKRTSYKRVARQAQRVRLKKKQELARLRMKLAAQLPCDRFRLATDQGWVKPMDALDVKKRCQFLRVEDEVEVLLTYRIKRYEVPIALSYQVGNEVRLHPMASERWLNFDPR